MHDVDTESDVQAEDDDYHCLPIKKSVSQNKSDSRISTTEQRQRQLIRNQHLKQETVRIIESLLDGKSDPQHLRKCVSLLSKSDYDDLNTERSLAKVCGYPLCDNGIDPQSPNPKQKFKIDLKRRKVFRMEERVLYCSSHCLEASSFLKQQLAEEALWLRYKDSDGYEGLYRQGARIQFLDVHAADHKQRQQGQKQDEEVGAGDELVPNREKKNLSSRESVSFPYIRQDHIKELQKSINSLQIKERDAPAASSSSVTRDSSHIIRTEGEESDTIVNGSGDAGDSVSRTISSSSNIAATRCNERDVTATEDDTGLDRGNKAPAADARERVHRVLNQWITSETLRFVLGEDFLQQYARMQDLHLRQDIADQPEDQRKRKLEQMIDRLIQRLDRQDFLEDFMDHQELINPDPETKFVKAAQEISIHEKQEKQKMIRKSGFKPRQRRRNDSSNSSSSNAACPDSSRIKSSSNSRKKVAFKDVDGNEEQTDPDSQENPGQRENGDPAVLPLACNQASAVRRQIAFDHLYEALTSHFSVQTAGVLLTFVRPVFYKMHLTPDSVVLSREEWTLVALFLFRFMELHLRLQSQRLQPDDVHKERIVGDHQELLHLLNNDKMKELSESFYPTSADWQQKVDLFMCQTGACPPPPD